LKLFSSSAPFIFYPPKNSDCQKKSVLLTGIFSKKKEKTQEKISQNE